MLEQENSLPGTKHESAALHGDRQLGCCESSAQMGRYVVGAFVVMLVGPVLRSDPREIGFEVAPRGWRGVLLDEERCRGVTAKQRQQAFADAAFGNEFTRCIGKFSQARRVDAQPDCRARLAKHRRRLTRTCLRRQRSWAT